MSILFSAVARGTQLLAQTASCAGNFTEVTAQILSKILPHDERLAFSTGNYVFHYISENKLVYICITDDKFPRGKAFSFLNEISRRFKTTFGDTPPIVIPNASCLEFARILETEVTRYNDIYNKVTLPKVKAELDELKNIMVKNVDKMALRGERLDTLMDRTDRLTEDSRMFQGTARRVERKYWWQNIKMYIILAVISVPMAYFIGALACGGLTWRNCVG